VNRGVVGSGAVAAQCRPSDRDDEQGSEHAGAYGVGGAEGKRATHEPDDGEHDRDDDEVVQEKSAEQQACDGPGMFEI